jgi:hypothetical protein
MTESNFVQLKQTKGTFEARGVLFNLKSERAFTEKTVTGGKQMRFANIGLRIADGEVMFLSLNASEKDFVYFSKPAAKKGEKPTTEKVEWAKRERFHKEGYRLIGMGLALAKDAETGKNEDAVYLDPFDAVKHIEDHAEDGMSVFVKGNIEIQSFEDANTKELKKVTKYVPTGIFLAKEPIDFQNIEKFPKVADFALPVVFKAVRRETEGDNVSFFIDFGFVGWKSYLEYSLETTETLAKVLKDKVKANTGITITGKIQSSSDVETVETEVWGERSNVGKQRTPARVVMMVTGARPETVDVDSYIKKELEAYIAACEEEAKNKANKKAGFESQESGSWGETSAVKTEESAW